MFRFILILAMIIALAIPALAKDDRGIVVRPVAPTGETVNGEQWLLTIGIDTYLSWPRLKTAVNDAKALKSILMERYTFDKNHVIELYDENATRKNILGALRDLTKKIKPEDSLLIFYAGHGHIDNITKKGSWIPVESSTDDPSAWIGNQDIKDYLNIDAIKAKHILLVSDSCFSGDFFRGQRGALPEVNDVVIKKAYQLSSRQAITSGGLEPVTDAGFGGNSIFSHFLVTALKNNTNPYLIPSELFPAVKSGVAQNAEQFPQMGSLYGVGGQEGGELVLFLKQENRLQGLSADSSARQKELEQLRKVEQEAIAAKQKEQTEITKRERELVALDKQIGDMKMRLGTSSARTSDSLDSMIVLAEQKEQQGNRLEELRQQREAEDRKRQGEIEQLKREAKEKLAENVKSDLAKYEKIASSKYAQDMNGAAWRALLTTYPEAKGVSRGDTEGFMIAVGLTLPKSKDKTTGMEFVPVPGGCFQMDKHEACVSDFSIGKFEVTQGQWQKVMGSNPSYFSSCGSNCPIEDVSWNDAQEFIRKLNSRSGKSYRLPTEAEWEYACHSGGKNDEYCGGNEVNVVAWHENNSRKKTHKVGVIKPNGLGIYDMSGNVWEWCHDWYGVYPNGQVQNYSGPSSGQERVLRGGSWNDIPYQNRAAVRISSSPSHSDSGDGFRLVLPTP